VTNEDIMLASVSNAMVLSFNSPVNKQQLDEAQRNGVEIKEYSVVYDALDDVQAMMAAHPSSALEAARRARWHPRRVADLQDWRRRQSRGLQGP